MLNLKFEIEDNLTHGTMRSSGVLIAAMHLRRPVTHEYKIPIIAMSEEINLNILKKVTI